METVFPLAGSRSTKTCQIYYPKSSCAHGVERSLLAWGTLTEFKKIEILLFSAEHIGTCMTTPAISFSITNPGSPNSVWSDDLPLPICLNWTALLLPTGKYYDSNSVRRYLSFLKGLLCPQNPRTTRTFSRNYTWRHFCRNHGFRICVE